MNLKKMIYSIWHNDAAISLNLCRTDLSVSLQIRLLEFCLEGLLNEVRHRNKTGERSQKRQESNTTQYFQARPCSQRIYSFVTGLELIKSSSTPSYELHSVPPNQICIDKSKKPGLAILCEDSCFKQLQEHICRCILYMSNVFDICRRIWFFCVSFCDYLYTTSWVSRSRPLLIFCLPKKRKKAPLFWRKLRLQKLIQASKPPSDIST